MACAAPVVMRPSASWRVAILTGRAAGGHGAGAPPGWIILECAKPERIQHKGHQGREGHKAGFSWRSAGSAIVYLLCDLRALGGLCVEFLRSVSSSDAGREVRASLS